MSLRRTGVWMLVAAWGSLALAQATGPVATVRGKVTLPDGKPAAGAEITYFHSDDPAGTRRQVKTDAQGQYELKDIHADSARTNTSDPFATTGGAISIKATQGQPGELPAQKFTVPPGLVVAKDFVLTRDLELSGKVIDDTTGQAVPGVQLIGSIRARGAGSTQAMLISDDTGHFKVTIPYGAGVAFSFMSGPNPALMFDPQWQQTRQYYWPLRITKMTSDRTDQVIHVKLLKSRPMSGKVLDEAGKGVGSAQVYADPRLQPVTTAADGTFAIAAIPADRRCTLIALSSSHGGIGEVSQDAKEVTITARPLQDRDCVVTTPDGLPAGKLSFTLMPRVSGQNYYQASVEAKTDDRGKCHLTKLIPGASYGVSWSGGNDQNRDYDDGTATLDLAKATAGQPLRFTAKQYLNTLMGQVVDPQGRPIANARISVTASQVLRTSQGYRDPLTQTAQDGSFQLEQLAAGTIQLSITAGGYHSLLISAPTDNVLFKATLHSTSDPITSRVQIQTPDGESLANARVTLLWEQDGQLRSESRTADAQGLISLDGAKSSATVICDLPGHGIALFTAAPGVEGEQRMVVRKVEEPWHIRVIGEDGKPIAGRRVQVNSVSNLASGESNSYTHVTVPAKLNDEQRETWGLVGKTDAQGRATFPRIARRQFGQIAIDRPGLSPLTRYMNMNSGGGEVEIVIRRPGTVEGKLLLPTATNGITLDQGHLSLQDQEADFYQSQQLKADGSFRFENIEPGTYQVSLSHQPNAPAARYLLPGDQEIVVKPGETAKPEIRLQEALVIRGKLLGVPKKEGARDPMVGLSGPWVMNMPTAAVDAEGKWELYVVEPGQYQLMYLTPDANSWTTDRSITVEAGSANENVVITAK